MSNHFNRFLPWHLKLTDGQVSVVWRDFVDIWLDAPFFYGQKQPHPHSADFETDFDAARTVQAQANIPLSGMIFHMSRCGSTLVHRMLSATGRVMCLAEPFPTEMLSYRLFDDNRIDTLRVVVDAYRRKRRPTEESLILKLQDIAPNFVLHDFRRAFPDVPWIFVYRDPVEVLMSQLSNPSETGLHWQQDRAHVARRLNLPELNESMSLAKFYALSLRHACATAVSAALTSPGKFLAVSYKRLPEAVWETVGPHFGLHFSDNDIDVMRHIANENAKTSAPFVADAIRKQSEASDEVRQLSRDYLEPVMQALQRLPQA